ncbi:hypothetical protein GCM10012284_44580 [Mangrovihabitans endophyticus]|uniref:Uncharacterized protein n=1 Tax=Mangrovihabitans endophyticus TaxID=1751298 RepID=A0A8J3C3L7_9ACTN|nr:hypothetical protein GCM10012284_44580 [Mangrovihabitans endophyticus]
MVPGSVVRGAFAARWIRQHGTPRTMSPDGRERFLTVFESGAVRFGPLYPHHSALRWLSAPTHKYGRPSDCTTPEPDLADTEADPVCTGCTTPLESARDGLDGADGLLTDRTHAGLDADDRPIDGQLYTRQRIRGGTRLDGLLTGPTDLLDQLTTDTSPLLLGGNRTASGRTTLTHQPATIDPPETTGQTVILRLHSPAIFVDDYGRPLPAPHPPDLARRLGIDNVHIERHWVRTDTVGGWHLASGLPKPTEQVTVAGSVYRLRCSSPPPSQALAALAHHGIGLRRHEGFGWISYPRAGDPA